MKNEFSPEIDDNKVLEKLGDALEAGDSSILSNSADINALLRKYPDGLVNLFKNYLEYCAEIIINRAIPGIDGLKPVQRRIYYTLAKNKTYTFRKCQRIAGDVLAYHPHGDAAVYEALVRLVDTKGVANIPIIRGQGSFGNVYSKEKAAAPRYTEACLNEHASDYLDDMQGVDFVPNFDDTEMEPALLPVKYPSILINPTQGIAVGLASNIPSFNVLDVLDLCIEYLQTGDIKTVIRPDHASGGVYVEEPAELMKIMKTGKGRILRRGKVEIVGKEIRIRELPFGVTNQDLDKKIAELNISGLVDNKDLSSKEGEYYVVYCSSANKTQQVLYSLYNDTDLESSINANMTVIVDGVPKLLGVWDIIKEWCKFREGVIIRQQKYYIGELEKKIRLTKAKILLLSNKEICDEYIRLVRAHKKAEAKEYLKTSFSDATDEDIKSMCSITISQLGDKEVFEQSIQATVDEIAYKQSIIDNINESLINELKILKGKFASMKRHTEITNVIYNYETNENNEVVDDSPCTILYKEGFIKKVSNNSYYKPESYDLVLTEGVRANSTLIGIDTEGRILRVYLENIDYCTSYDTGVYLPTYWELEDNDLVWLDLLKEETKMLIYSDGKIGFVDTSEWYGNRKQYRVIPVGISSESHKLIDVVDITDFIAVITKKGYFSIKSTDEIMRKKRTARTAVFNVGKDDSIEYYAMLEAEDVNRTIVDGNQYLALDGKLAYFSTEKILDSDKFIQSWL